MMEEGVALNHNYAKWIGVTMAVLVAPLRRQGPAEYSMARTAVTTTDRGAVEKRRM